MSIQRKGNEVGKGEAREDHRAGNISLFHPKRGSTFFAKEVGLTADVPSLPKVFLGFLQASLRLPSGLVTRKREVKMATKITEKAKARESIGKIVWKPFSWAQI